MPLKDPEEYKAYMKQYMKKTADIRAYRKQWERDNRSCKARGVKHSGQGKPPCWSDNLPSKTLVVKKAEKDKPFLVTFD